MQNRHAGAATVLMRAGEQVRVYSYPGRIETTAADRLCLRYLHLRTVAHCGDGNESA